MDLKTLRIEMEKKRHQNDYIELCISYAKNLQEKNFPTIFDMKHLSLLLNIKYDKLFKILALKDYHYKEIDIKKKSGGIRKLSAPSDTLKDLQKWILDNILYNMNAHKFSTGFILGKSIVDNASLHLNKECLINLDIKDFFPSISAKRVYLLFKSMGYNKNVSLLLTGLCTFKEKLPQGAPTSPYISNLTCINLDKRLSALALKIGADYSRYADDITFSGSKSITRLIPLIKKIITEEGFEINEKKERVLFQHHKQMVTGLIVNSTQVNVPKKTERYLRQQIYYCKTRGVFDSLCFQGLEVSNYKEHLYGIAYFIKMVNPAKGNKFLLELNKIDWES